MTHRDRAGDPPGRREAAGDAGHRQGLPTPPAVRPRDRRRLPKPFGRRRPCLAMPGHRHATRSRPKTLGSRLYGSISARLGIMRNRDVRYYQLRTPEVCFDRTRSTPSANTRHSNVIRNGYGQVLRRRVRAMGIRDRPRAPRSPWQNTYVAGCSATTSGAWPRRWRSPAPISRCSRSAATSRPAA